LRPLDIFQQPIEATRTPDNSCKHEAETIVDGKRYSARSRRGAPMALARVLIAAGIIDQPVTVTHRGVRDEIRYRSLYRLAGRTFTESAGTPVCETRYIDPSKRFAPSREEVETCVTAASGARLPRLPTSADIAPEIEAKTAVPQLEAATIPRICEREGCGETFLPRRSWSTFCSGRCRVAAHRRKLASPSDAATNAANYTMIIDRVEVDHGER
jgi:hypothetical protein